MSRIEGGGSIGIARGSVATAAPRFSVGIPAGLGSRGSEVSAKMSLGFTRAPDVRTVPQASFGTKSTLRLTRSPVEGVFAGPKASLKESKLTVASGINRSEGLFNTYASISGVKSIPRRLSAYAPAEVFSRSGGKPTRKLPESRPLLADISGIAPGLGGRKDAASQARIDTLRGQTISDALQILQRQNQRQRDSDLADQTGRRVDIIRLPSRPQTTNSSFVEKRAALVIGDPPPINPGETQNPVHRKAPAVTSLIASESQRTAIHKELGEIETKQARNNNVIPVRLHAAPEASTAENSGIAQQSIVRGTDAVKPALQPLPKLPVHEANSWIMKQKARMVRIQTYRNALLVVTSGIDISQSIPAPDMTEVQPEMNVKKNGILMSVQRIFVINWKEFFDTKNKRKRLPLDPLPQRVPDIALVPGKEQSTLEVTATKETLASSVLPELQTVNGVRIDKQTQPGIKIITETGSFTSAATILRQPVVTGVPIFEVRKTRQKLGSGFIASLLMGSSHKADNDKTIYFKIDEPVQKQRLRDLRVAINRIFSIFDFTSTATLSDVAKALPDIAKPTESTLIQQFRRNKDGSNRDWRFSLFVSNAVVNRTRAAQAGAEAIRSMPAVVAKEHNGGVDAKEDDVDRVLSGDSRRDDFALAP